MKRFYGREETGTVHCRDSEGKRNDAGRAGL